MRAKSILSMLILSAATVSLAADSFDYKIADIRVMQDRAVQTDLGIDEALRAKLNKHAAWFDGELKKMQEKHKDRFDPTKPPPNDIVQEMNKKQEELKKRVLGELSDAQVKRLRELTIQFAGMPALMEPTIAKRIGLTDAQLKKLRSSFEEMVSKSSKIEQEATKPVYEKFKNRQPANEEEARKLQEEIQKEIAAVQEKIAPKTLKLRDEWFLVIKKTVKAIQLNRFEDLQGKLFKPPAS
ncbi:hypothetical protein QPK87_19550 [Kamptonema cortianum]|nr:hypothetical protein [Geitlerinema splendidum]MDK3158752.1 hypothetical protein [Kamptonema cortianum]